MEEKPGSKDAELFCAEEPLTQALINTGKTQLTLWHFLESSWIFESFKLVHSSILGYTLS